MFYFERNNKSLFDKIPYEKASRSISLYMHQWQESSSILSLGQLHSAHFFLSLSFCVSSMHFTVMRWLAGCCDFIAKTNLCNQQQQKNRLWRRKTTTNDFIRSLHSRTRCLIQIYEALFLREIVYIDAYKTQQHGMRKKKEKKIVYNREAMRIVCVYRHYRMNAKIVCQKVRERVKETEPCIYKMI